MTDNTHTCAARHCFVMGSLCRRHVDQRTSAMREPDNPSSCMTCFCKRDTICSRSTEARLERGRLPKLINSCAHSGRAGCAKHRRWLVYGLVYVMGGAAACVDHMATDCNSVEGCTCCSLWNCTIPVQCFAIRLYHAVVLCLTGHGRVPMQGESFWQTTWGCTVLN